MWHFLPNWDLYLNDCRRCIAGLCFSPLLTFNFPVGSPKTAFNRHFLARFQIGANRCAKSILFAIFLERP